LKGKYPCPKCGENDWEPNLWVEGEPYDECKNCGYKFTSKDVPKAEAIT
jgi:Zn ribbon nucleic-acid-binding protein